MIETTLIISIYKNLDALALIFKSLQAQYKPGSLEVLVAEDNDSEVAKNFINAWQNQMPFPLVHLQQDDNGFRKCKILNAAIRHAKGTYLIFIDGDCILHPRFIYSHVQAKKLGAALYGRRVMLSENLTQQFYQKKQLSLLNPILLLFSKTQRLDAAWYLPFLPPKHKIGIWGHNWSIHKSDILIAKGFDESYVEAGIGEDTDIEWRLHALGISFLRLKNRFIQYHLWHPEHYHSTIAVQQKLADKKVKFAATQNTKLLEGSLD